MKYRIVKTLCTGAICALVMLGAQSKSNAACSGFISSDGSGANMRIGPSTDYQVVAKLDEGDRVFVDYTFHGWYYVRTDYGSGWINGNLIFVLTCGL
jgi:uncharacterized protein YraI